MAVVTAHSLPSVFLALEEIVGVLLLGTCQREQLETQIGERRRRKQSGRKKAPLPPAHVSELWESRPPPEEDSPPTADGPGPLLMGGRGREAPLFAQLSSRGH